jgi:hypothetical protein
MRSFAAGTTSARAAELLLFGLIIGGQFHMQQIDGWQELKQVSTAKSR